ncbi:MAG: ABC transporter permease subunit [Halobacteriovoraceae bacterium]|jgi:microcin C transport system permease protein|nr:ABC transporter permease subunit [Halobacteriovoraceae bacterium]
MIEKMLSNNLSVKRWRRFKARKSAFISTIIFLLMVLATIFAPMIANNKPIYMSYKGNSYFPVFKTYSPKDFGIGNTIVMSYKKLEIAESDTVIWPIVKWNPFESNEEVYSYPSPPTNTNLMGTDESGRDVFARILYGFKYSISYAFLVWVLSLILGVTFGGIMGYFGGRVDIVGQRMVEVFSTIPTFFLLLILISIFTPNMLLLVTISSIFGWVPISYYIRGEFLKNRKREFVEAALSMGATSRSIIIKHILPNSLVPVITFAPFVISSNVISLSMLDYLGFGLPVPTPSWGELLAQAQKHFTVAWWLAVFPSGALFVTLTILNLIGEGVRDAMDPNMH